MSSNKRDAGELSPEPEEVKRPRASQGEDLRAIGPMALSVALGNHRTYFGPGTGSNVNSIPYPNAGTDSSNVYMSTYSGPSNVYSSTNAHSNLALPMPVAQESPMAQAPMSTSPENLTLDMTPATPAPPYTTFGSTYHHTGAPHPYTTRFTNLCGLRIGNTPFEHVNMAIPSDMTKEDSAELKTKWTTELERQKANPPALPRTQVPDLPPKEHLGEPIPFPVDGKEADQQRIQVWNDWLSSEIQRNDRARNNQAAKKSRETRIEALERTRTMLNDVAAERDWLRFKVLQLGGDLSEWDGMDVNLKGRVVEVIDQRVKESDQRLDEEKKRSEAAKRAQRTRNKQEAQRAAAASEALVQQGVMQQQQGAMQQQIPGMQSLDQTPEPAGYYSGAMGVDDGGFLANMDFLGTP